MKKEKYYNDIEIRSIVMFHVVLYIILLLIGLFMLGMGSGQSNFSTKFFVLGIPLIFCLIPIITVFLQQKNSKWGYLYLINILILILFIYSNISSLLINLNPITLLTNSFATIFIPLVFIIGYIILILRMYKR